RARATVDEHELRPEDETLAFEVLSNRNDSPASVAIDLLDIARHESRAAVRHEQHGAGDDQRVLVFLADSLPVRRVRKKALVRFEVLLLFDLRRERLTGVFGLR